MTDVQSSSTPERMWTVGLTFTEEEERTTRADAILEANGRHHHGWGRARRSPADANVPRIGEELAAARALSDLTHQLLHAAAEEIETREGHPVSVHG